MKAKNPLFSVIIPTYERKGILKRCLNAVAKVDYPTEKFEVIVVDDGSKSPPEEIVKSYSDKLDILLITQANTGPGGARNTGAESAKGRFLVFTDDDCEPFPDWLLEYEKAFEQYPHNFLGGKTVNALEDNPYSTASELLVHYLYYYNNSDPENALFFNSSNIAIPREDFFESGAFDVITMRNTAEDRELCDRWLSQGRKLTYVDKARVYHSHSLSLLSFWRQHFNYGRGAHYFWIASSKRGKSKVTIPKGSFYLGLIRYPYKKKINKVHTMSLLLVTSQASYILGYLWERALSTVHST